MEEAIKAIQNTPVPTILIVAGLLFLLLGFVNKLGGMIEVSSEQRKLTTPIGLLVLTLGLVLHFMPSPITPFVVQKSKESSVSNSASSNVPAVKIDPVGATESNKLPKPGPWPTEVQAVIKDPDGYTNVRSGQGDQYSIIDRVSEGEVFYTTPQQSDWWPVKTKNNILGYMHRSRIKVQH